MDAQLLPSLQRPMTHDRAQTWPYIINPSHRSSKQGKVLFEMILPTTKDVKGDSTPDRDLIYSPRMYEYEDWASDDGDDGDDEDVQWNDGITDFALFDTDRRHAQARGESIPSKWRDMLSDQASALSRANERHRQTEVPRTPSAESMPGLTPDGSPVFHDDLDVKPYHGQLVPKTIAPSYLNTLPRHDSVIGFTYQSDCVEPAQDKQSSAHTARARAASDPQTQTTLRRPGMSICRTSSGRRHVWRTPSEDLFPVKEDSAAERRAELIASSGSRR